MFIERHIDSFIRRMLSQFKIVLIIGPIQVGKTSLIKEKYSSGYNYVVLDDYNELEIAKNDPPLFFKNNNLPLVIDEVQRAPELFLQMKLIADKAEQKGFLILSGSQTYKLNKTVSDSLAGRVCIIDMSSLSMREKYGLAFREAFIPSESYLKARKKSIVKYDNLWTQIFRGSMPELQNPEIEWEPFYRSYVRTYIDRDVAELINAKNLLKFSIFMKALAARTGELFNASSVAIDVGVSTKTIVEWVSILEASGIIFLLHPYSNNVTNRAIKTPKIYFTDTGLVCYLVGWNNATVAMNGAMSGSLFETFVISEIVKSYLNAGHDTSHLFFYRDKEKKEIDLIIEDNDILYPIEIKKTAKPSKDMAKSFEVLSRIENRRIGQGCILCQSEKQFILSENLVVMPIEYV